MWGSEQENRKNFPIFRVFFLLRQIPWIESRKIFRNEQAVFADQFAVKVDFATAIGLSDTHRMRDQLLGVFLFPVRCARRGQSARVKSSGSKTTPRVANDFCGEKAAHASGLQRA